jgi:glycerophosphoryl diester phosphodiesterase
MHPLLDLSRRVVVGHRGNSAHAPENTLESFRQAVALGVDSLEFDVHLTADGKVVVMHDSHIDRTTDGTGEVRQMTLSAIRAHDAGARFVGRNGSTVSYRGKGIVAPTVDEVLEEFPNTAVLIEIKTAAASQALLDRIKAHHAEARTIVASFDDDALSPYRDTTIPIAASMNAAARLYFPALFRRRVTSVPFRNISIPPTFRGLPLPLAGYATILRPLGVTVQVWTVDDPAQARHLWEEGIQGIISNDPGAMIRERAAMQPPK